MLTCQSLDVGHRLAGFASDVLKTIAQLAVCAKGANQLAAHCCESLLISLGNGHIGTALPA